MRATHCLIYPNASVTPFKKLWQRNRKSGSQLHLGSLRRWV